LERYEIRKPLVSYHEHNEAARADQIIEALRRGDSVALVSDAGTPLVSDPGYRVVGAAIDAGFAVVPLPGASAVLAALAASGLPTDEFFFAGFLPSKAGARRKRLEQLARERATVIVYESPHRIVESLTDIAEIFGERCIVLARELTKIHEEFLRGPARQICDQLTERASIKGEITLVLSGAQEEQISIADPLEEIARLETAGMDRMEAIKSVAKQMGLPKREVYRLAAEQVSNRQRNNRD